MTSLDRKAAQAVVDAIWSDEEGIVQAIVDDGWPEEMARVGLAMHRRTWDIERLADTAGAEIEAVRVSGTHRIVWPERVHHIWPALPGTGMTPLLFGVLLGIPQAVRPSRRGLGFARRVARTGGWDLIEPDGVWSDADVVVVSGSDETVAAVRAEMAGRGEVIGYGHRVSFAVVVDGDGVELGDVAEKVAADVVMWHQEGCFSVRAVLFCGSVARRRGFCEVLAEQIGILEQEWGAAGVEDGELARRAQALGMAQMKGPVFCDGVGYIREEAEPFGGVREAVHSVTVHPVDGADGLADAVDLPVTGVQGVAMGGDWSAQRSEWIDAIGRIGATRIAAVGAMQSPPAEWWHDGMANVLSLGRVVTIG